MSKELEDIVDEAIADFTKQHTAVAIKEDILITRQELHSLRVENSKYHKTELEKVNKVLYNQNKYLKLIVTICLISGIIIGATSWANKEYVAKGIKYVGDMVNFTNKITQ